MAFPWRPPFRLPEPGLAPGAKGETIGVAFDSWESEILMVWIIQFLGMSPKHPIESHWKSIAIRLKIILLWLLLLNVSPKRGHWNFSCFRVCHQYQTSWKALAIFKPRNWAVVKFHQQVGNLLFGFGHDSIEIIRNPNSSAQPPCMPLVLLLLLGTLVKSKPYPSALRDQWVKEANEQWKTPWLFRVYGGLYYPVIEEF